MLRRECAIWSIVGMMALLGCRKAIGNASADSIAQDYFPLQVGNSWIFETYDLHDTPHTSMGTFSIQVVGTLSISDTTYSIVTQDWTEVIPDTVYARKDGLKVFWRLEGRDLLVYDFAAPQGTYWEFFLPSGRPWNKPPVRVRANALREEGFDDGIGTYPDRRYFGFEPPGYEGAWYEVYLAGVGPVFIKRYPTEMEVWDIGRLKEAHVGGKVIPGTQVTSLPTTSLGQLKKHIQTRR